MMKKVFGEVPYVFLMVHLDFQPEEAIQINIALHHWEIHEKKDPPENLWPLRALTVTVEGRCGWCLTTVGKSPGLP